MIRINMKIMECTWVGFTSRHYSRDMQAPRLQYWYLHSQYAMLRYAKSKWNRNYSLCAVGQD